MTTRCSVVCRCSLNPILPWLWFRPIQPLAWALPYAADVALKRFKKKKKKERKNPTAVAQVTAEVRVSSPAWRSGLKGSSIAEAASQILLLAWERLYAACVAIKNKQTQLGSAMWPSRKSQTWKLPCQDLVSQLNRCLSRRVDGRNTLQTGSPPETCRQSSSIQHTY